MNSVAQKPILVSKANFDSWIEQGLRSLGELKDSDTPTDLKFDISSGLVSIKINSKVEKKGVLIEH